MSRGRLPHLRAIAEIAQRRGDERTFVVAGERRLGFQEFVERASAAGAALGAGPGDRVALLGQNSLEWCLAFWGAVLHGATVAALNGWWERDEIGYALEHSGARVLVADAKRRSRAGPVAARVVALEDGGAGRAPLPAHVPAEDDAAVLLYTSGTTGRPKAAICTHRNVAAAQELVAARGGGGERAPIVSLLTSPLFHVSGLHGILVQGLLFGQQLVLIEGRMTPEACLDAIERERVTFWATVPTLVWRACTSGAAEGRDLSSLTRIQYGGSPAGAELQRLARATFPSLRRGAAVAYGMTETNGTVAVLAGDEAADRPGSVGPPLPGVEFRIDAGEILVRGPVVTPGYFGDPAATAAAIDGGWLRTGDLGHLDGDGYLYVTDRKTDMIIRGGENVYCVEIEQRLLEHPDVRDAAVVGVPHAELGEEVKAVVVGAADPDALRAWVGERLAAFKVPSLVEVRDDPLPRTATGKILKGELR